MFSEFFRDDSYVLAENYEEKECNFVVLSGFDVRFRPLVCENNL